MVPLRIWLIISELWILDRLSGCVSMWRVGNHNGQPNSGWRVAATRRGSSRRPWLSFARSGKPDKGCRDARQGVGRGIEAMVVIVFMNFVVILGGKIQAF